MKPLIIIAGPTAVGKTEFTIALAKKMKTEIISADSMQIYRHMCIGTAVPDKLEQCDVPHHLIQFVDPFERYSVANYASDAKEIIAKLQKSALIPIVTGGTGLYINSLLFKMNFADTKKNCILRRSLQQDLEKYGKNAMYQRLISQDHQAATRIHPNNTKKVLRALEIVAEQGVVKDFKCDLIKEDAYLPHLYILNRARATLYERINKRVDIMIEHGLEDEVRHLMQMGLTEAHQSMKGIGYKETFAYLKGAYDKKTWINTLKQNTRRYAKRQLTWFRRYHYAKWLDIDDPMAYTQLFNDILNLSSTKGV